MKSCACISHPFHVQTDIVDKHNMQLFDNETKIVCVCLKAIADIYLVEQDTEDFEIA